MPYRIGPRIHDVVFDATNDITFWFCDDGRKSNTVRKTTIWTYLSDEVVCQSSLLEGIFKVRIVVHPSSKTEPLPGAKNRDWCHLDVPSGILKLVHGEPRVHRPLPELRLEPGRYLATFDWRGEEHDSLKRVEDYPEADSPEGLLELWPLSSSVS